MTSPPSYLRPRKIVAVSRGSLAAEVWQDSTVPPPPPHADDEALRAVVRELRPGLPPPPPEESRRQPMDLSGVILGIIVFVAGFALIIVGLSGDLSCGVVKALGGQCYTLLGYTYIEPSFQIVPTILIGFGILFIAVGSITAARAARG